MSKIGIFWTPLKKGGSRRDFFRKWTSLYVWTERPKICYHVYLYVIRHFLTNFSWFFRTFSKNRHFWKFSTFLEKGGPGPPGVAILGKVRVQNREKWGKNADLRNKHCVLPQFLGLWPHFRGPPRVDLNFTFSKITKIFKNHDFTKFLKRGFPKCDFFRKWTSLWVCMNRPKICYHV